MRWYRIPLMFAVLTAVVVCLATPNDASAAEFKSGTDVTIPTGRVVNEDLYVTGNDVTIAGRVNGDVIAAARTVTVTGQITGSLQALAGTVKIEGSVNGSVRMASGELTISGDVGGDVVTASGSVNVEGQGAVDGDVLLAGGDVAISGPVGGDIRGNAGTLTIDAPVDGKVDVTADTVELHAKARIGGDLIYRSKHDASLDAGAAVSGRTEKKAASTRYPGDTVFSWLSSSLFRLLAGLISGLVIVLLLPRGSAAVADAVRRAPFTSFLLGLALFWFFPVLLLIVLVTLIGIPIALIGFAVYGIVLYLSQVFVGLAIGRLILPKSWDVNGRGYNLLAMTLGVILLGAVRMIPVPVLPSVVAGITAVFALGAVVLAVRTARRGGLVAI